MSAPTRGLSPAELEELGRFLASPQLEATAMSVPMLEGFLTAVVVGPRQVMPKEWLAGCGTGATRGWRRTSTTKTMPSASSRW